jgi:CubicO group peptidase (beta-lactamase class C family)
LPEDYSVLAEALNQGALQGVAPALVLLLWSEGAPVFEAAAGEAGLDTIFDLASLTKPLATAPLAVDLAASDALAWHITLAEAWGQAVPEDKAGITVEQLLCHSSGFAAHRPYYTALDLQPKSARRGFLKAMLLNEPLEYEPGSRAVYSDLGYMLLGILLEDYAGWRLEKAVAHVHAKLIQDAPRYSPVAAEPVWSMERIAPCGPLPGRDSVHGQVEDENAFALGGVAGHAGLFGTARQTAALMDALVRASQGDGPWPGDVARRLFLRDAGTPGSTRTPGFDTPSGDLSAAGAGPPAETVGHLGFTGASIWWHPPTNRGVVLLTNRVALGRGNEKIKEFRHNIHNLAWPLLGL